MAKKKVDRPTTAEPDRLAVLLKRSTPEGLRRGLVKRNRLALRVSDLDKEEILTVTEYLTRLHYHAAALMETPKNV